MPLLKGRFVSPVKASVNSSSKEKIYTIPHTKEQFTSKDEFNRRLALYEDEVWTCQCTGQIKMTHEDAFRSEEKVREYLKENFEPHYRKPVLELVHHSTDVLDTLTDKAWRTVQTTLVIGEPVALKVKANGNVIEGTVVKVDMSAEPSSSSPSSNKENINSGNTENEGSPRKYQPPKLLPYRYNVKLSEEEKIISGIPASDLNRCERPPSKELIKMFIRSSAWRGGYQFNSPWVVNDDLVKQYALPSKFADLFVSPAKMAELGKKAMEEASTDAKKRKRSVGKSPSPNKRMKTDNGSKKKSNSDSSKKSKKDSSGKPSTPQKVTAKGSPAKKSTPKKDTVEIDSDSSSDDEEELTLAEIKKRKSPVKKEMTLADLKKKLSAKKKSEKSKKDGKEKKKRKKKVEETVEKRPRGRPKKDLSSQTTPAKKNPAKKETPKKMKQMTLFDMKGKKGGTSTPTKSPKSPSKSKPTTPRLPPLALRLQKAVKKNDGTNRCKQVVAQLLARCAKELSKQQVKKMPADLNEMITKKMEHNEERSKLAKMSPEERKEYQKKRLKEYMKKRQKELRRRFEDTDLDLKPLPVPRPVATPDGIPNEMFGSAAMVTEFIMCCSGLLMPDAQQYDISTDNLLKSLNGGAEYGSHLANVMVILLRTLLQDEIAVNYSEIGTKLSEIPVNQYTVSELVRLCLRKRDTDNDSNSSDDSDIEDDDDDLPEDLVEQLETCDIHELTAQQKMTILECLVHRMLNSYSLQEHITQLQAGASELWRQRIKMQKERNDDKKKGKKLVTEEDIKALDEPENEKKDLTLESFYGVKPEEDDGDLASVVKRRRMLTAKAMEDKKRKDREDKEKREKIEDQWRKQKEEIAFERNFADKILKAKLAMRQAPLGTDRNHSRYWIFSGDKKGIYVEKGWATREMEYSVRKDDAQDLDISDYESESDSGDEEKEESSKKRQSTRKDASTTLPHIGQNLWFVYDKEEEIDQLMKNLNSLGARESELKSELVKFVPRVKETLKTPATKSKRSNSEEKEEPDSENVDLIEGFQNELIDVERRLQNGGLGGGHDFSAFEKSVLSQTKIEELGGSMKLVMENIADKFIKGLIARKTQRPIMPPSDEETKDEDDDEIEEPEMEIIPIGKQIWCDNVDTCSSVSRLHMLLGLLDSCVKWEKSAENSKCKVCRKKGDEDFLLLCDECNQAFHLYCLRPALQDVPTEDWFCPACAPLTRRKHTRDKNYKELAGEGGNSSDDEDEDSEEEEEEEIVHEETCAVCGAADNLVDCFTCVSAFHLDCHEPPLRHFPRGNWRCMQCKSGKRIRRSRRSGSKKRKRYSEDFVEGDEYEVETKKGSSRSNKRKHYSEDEYDEESKRRSSRKNHRKRYSEDFLEGDEYEEQTQSRKSRNTRMSNGHCSDIVEESAVESRNARANRRNQVVEYTEEPEQPEEDIPDDVDIESLQPSANLKENGIRKSKGTPKAEISPLKIIEKIMLRLRRNKHAWPFMDAVRRDEVPDYYDIVKQPVDLTTMQSKCDNGQYTTLQEFVNEVSLLFSNAELYNKVDSLVGKCVAPMEKLFRDLFMRNIYDCDYPRDPDLVNPKPGNDRDNSLVLLDDHSYFASPHS